MLKQQSQSLTSRDNSVELLPVTIDLGIFSKSLNIFTLWQFTCVPRQGAHLDKTKVVARPRKSRPQRLQDSTTPLPLCLIARALKLGFTTCHCSRWQSQGTNRSCGAQGSRLSATINASWPLTSGQNTAPCKIYKFIRNQRDYESVS